MRSVVIVLKFPVEILLAHSARKMVPVANRAAAMAHAEKRAAIVDPVRRAAEEAREVGERDPERRAAVFAGWNG